MTDEGVRGQGSLGTRAGWSCCSLKPLGAMVQFPTPGLGRR